MFSLTHDRHWRGRDDGLWEFGLRPWDRGGGADRDRSQAGPRHQGGMLDLEAGHIVVTNRKLHRAMREGARRAGRRRLSGECWLGLSDARPGRG